LETVFVPGTPRLALSVSGRGPLVLFLHGIGGNRHAWDGQVEFFSREFTAVAWDARGYGDSEDYEGSLHFREFSTDLVRVLDHLRAEKAHLVGLSMGGRIARSFALAHPERLSSLVLANTSPGFDALSPEQVTAFVEQRRSLDPIAQAKRLLAPDAHPEAFERLVSSLRAVHRDSYLKTVEASVSQDLAAPLENITTPTLVIGSEGDPLYAPSIARDMARRIPQARLVMLPGGHVSNLEQPDRFNAAVLEFLKTVERQS
jgi:pimeloyl-ACP methyl ester carboxylesterase